MSSTHQDEPLEPGARVVPESDSASKGLEASDYDDEFLRGLDEPRLAVLLIGEHDRVPRNLIDECARRGPAMLDELEQVLIAAGRWSDLPVGHWWMVLHTIHILGLIPGARAGEMLKRAMIRLAEDDDEDDTLGEWLSGYWPALFANKPHEVIASFSEDARDRNLSPYLRNDMLSVMVADAHRNQRPELESRLDTVATLAADPDESETLIELALPLLIDFPRARHRTLLDEYAARNEHEIGAMFDADEVEQAFETKVDRPDWARFSDPWSFYSADEIAARQQRWAAEVTDDESEDDFEELEAYFPDDDLLLDEDDYESTEPYVRAAPKVGRNDPCPCGSGKKYKKCCLEAER